MARVKGTVAAQRRRRKYIKAAKGQFGHRKSRYIQARRSVIKGLSYAFRDRKVKKREFRRLWIIRINAACQEAGITYSRFIKGLSDVKIDMDRKVLSELAISSPAAFKKLVKVVKEGKIETASKSERETTAKKLDKEPKSGTSAKK